THGPRSLSRNLVTGRPTRILREQDAGGLSDAQSSLLAAADALDTAACHVWANDVRQQIAAFSLARESTTAREKHHRLIARLESSRSQCASERGRVRLVSHQGADHTDRFREGTRVRRRVRRSFEGFSRTAGTARYPHNIFSCLPREAWLTL